MSPATEQLLASALALPEAERLELAGALLAASEPPVPGLTGAAYAAEIDRRSAEIDAGTVTPTPWPEVLRRTSIRTTAQNLGH